MLPGHSMQYSTNHELCCILIDVPLTENLPHSPAKMSCHPYNKQAEFLTSRIDKSLSSLDDALLIAGESGRRV